MSEELTMESPKDYIELDKLKVELGLSDTHLKELLACDEFPSIRLGKKLHVVPLTAYRKFIQEPQNIVSLKKFMNRKGGDALNDE